jgi:hypothetical protein
MKLRISSDMFRSFNHCSCRLKLLFESRVLAAETFEFSFHIFIGHGIPFSLGHHGCVHVPPPIMHHVGRHFNFITTQSIPLVSNLPKGDCMERGLPAAKIRRFEADTEKLSKQRWERRTAVWALEGYFGSKKLRACTHKSAMSALRAKADISG